MSKYSLDNWQLGRKLDGALYDVILKPTIRPKEIAKADRSELVFKGTYHGFATFDIPLGECPERETPYLYELRLRRDVIERADRYYARRIIHRLDSELIEYAGELWQIGQEIQAAKVSGRHYRNSGACLQYGRPCEYLPLCSGNDTEDSDSWKLDTKHSELNTERRHSLLTHSSIQTFQSCRRKYHYRYNLGLRRRDEDEGEAIYIGTLLHLALEAWWRAQQREES